MRLHVSKLEMVYFANIANFNNNFIEKDNINSKTYTKPIISKEKTYEVDELLTNVRHKKNFFF